MIRNRVVLAGVLALSFATFVLAGCGSGSDDSDTGSAELTQAEYVKQADEICSKANAEQEAGLRKATQGVTKALSPSQRTDLVMEVGVPPLQEEVKALDELGAPSGQEAEAEALVTALEKGIAEIEKDPLAFSEAEITPFAEAERAAKKLQLEVCGTP